MDRRLLQPHPQKQPHKSRAPDSAAHRPCARRHGASEWRRRAGAGGRSRWRAGVRPGHLRHLPGHSDGQPHPHPVHAEAGTERTGAFHGRDGTGAAGERDAGGAGGRRWSALLPDGGPQFQGDPGPGDPDAPLYPAGGQHALCRADPAERHCGDPDGLRAEDRHHTRRQQQDPPLFHPLFHRFLPKGPL